MVNGFGPHGRSHHTTALVGSKLFLFGGRISVDDLNDMWALDLNSRTLPISGLGYFDPISP